MIPLMGRKKDGPAITGWAVWVWDHNDLLLSLRKNKYITYPITRTIADTIETKATAMLMMGTMLSTPHTMEITVHPV